MLKNTSFLVSKTLTKEGIAKLMERAMEPVYGYQGGKAPPNVAELAYGLWQLKRVIPQSFAYFENTKKIGYISSILR